MKLAYMASMNHICGFIIKCCISVNVRRKRSSIYRMSAPQKKRQKVLRHSKKKQQDKKKKNETEGTTHERKSF